jgi:glycolate oxidase FAD binding subunit
LVGARGALGFLGEVILRTRPLPEFSQWYSAQCADPAALFPRLHRPVSVLWDGASIWALLEGHRDDVTSQAAGVGLSAVDGPPPLPTGSRRSVAPSSLGSLTGSFVAEVGMGIVHHAEQWTAPVRDARVLALAAAVKAEFDPFGRLNPGIDV